MKSLSSRHTIGFRTAAILCSVYRSTLAWMNFHTRNAKTLQSLWIAKKPIRKSKGSLASYWHSHWRGIPRAFGMTPGE